MSKFVSCLLSPIPFWKPFLGHPRGTHFAAFRKFAFLWLISVLPLLLAALIGPIEQQSDLSGYVTAFFRRLANEFKGTHQFIYTVSFVTPVLYLLIEQHQQYLSFLKSKKRKIEGVIKIAPDGFGWVLFWAFWVFLLTTAGYAVATTRNMRTEETFLDSISQSTVLGVYVFAMFCWYYTILESTDVMPANFADTKKKNESDFSSEFDERIAGREQ